LRRQAPTEIQRDFHTAQLRAGVVWL
jgi:hypothetical protein